MVSEENRKKLSNVPIIWILPAVVLLIALLPLPYGYYTLLRIIVCLAAGFIAFTAYDETGGVGLQVLVFTLIALLFNPIFPIHLTREIWLIINLLVAGAFCVFGSTHRHKKIP